jgi:hypothetical protein
MVISLVRRYAESRSASEVSVAGMVFKKDNAKEVKKWFNKERKTKLMI